MAFPVTFYAILKMGNGAERSKTECYCIHYCIQYYIVTVSSFRLPLRVKICGA